RVIAAGIRSLQRSTHGARQWDRRAAVIGFAHEVPLGTSGNVASKAVPAESIDDIDEPSSSDRCPVLRHVKLEEFPVVSRRVEALGPLHHGLARDELNDGSRRIYCTVRRIGGGERRVETAG